MSPTVLDHVLLTRFNLPTPGPEGLVRSADGWLEKRWSLFERYCRPSVLAQTTSAFRWIVYLDPSSPDWLLRAVREHGMAGHYRPILREVVSPIDLIDDLAQVTGRTSDRLLTTNLDNDDGLAVDFVARVQAALDPTRAREAIYVGRGLIRGPHGLYARTDRYNAFCSVSELWDGAVTCWSDWHNLLPASMPVTVLTGRPAWLQVVHGTNVSNRIRGRLVSPAGFEPLFGPLVSDVPEPGVPAILADRVLRGPLRGLTEAMRAAAKRVVVVMLGKRGLERARYGVLAARRVAGRAARAVRDLAPARGQTASTSRPDHRRA